MKDNENKKLDRCIINDVECWTMEGFIRNHDISRGTVFDRIRIGGLRPFPIRVGGSQYIPMNASPEITNTKGFNWRKVVRL